MIFGDVPVREAAGAILAHSLRRDRLTLRKGRRLAAEDIEALAAAGIETVTAVRLEDGDLDENEAASRVAAAAAGPNLSPSAPGTGRCNLTARVRGIVVVDRDRVDAVNLTDEAVTLATVAPWTMVQPGDLVATVKIITFAVAGGTVARCAAVAAEGQPVDVAPFRRHAVGLIQTRLPGLKESVFDKAEEVTRARLAAIGCELTRNVICPHTADAVAGALDTLSAAGCDIALALGASAIADRRDVIPAAVTLRGGTVEHFGMPVDPGNLMLLARLGRMRVLGLPGSARSPRLHGFDWVLQRLVAGIQVTGEDLMRMGVGGLLKEIPTRPLPRASAVPAAGSRDEEPMTKRTPRIAAIILAAGQSRRMGRVNKLLAEIDGRPMVAHVADAVLASRAGPVVVVTGHEPAQVAAALGDRPVTLAHNPDYAEGLSTSLKAALAALPDDIDGAIVCLGDMPDVTPDHVNRLIEAFDPDAGAAICVPTFDGKRGNPVLWHRRFFRDMTEISGDVGARHLIGANEDVLVEVPMDDAAVLTDLDTPAALDAHRARRTRRDTETD